VQAVLRAAGRGVQIRTARVPIAPQAIIFDLLNGGDKDWGVFSPYRDLGHAAARAAAAGPFALGTVGAGTGATTATFKGGLGSASTTLSSGHGVAALAVVNAIGSPTIGTGRHFWAAPFEVDAEFGGLGWPAKITPADVALRSKGMLATTIGLVATDAALTKSQCKRLAIMAHDGLARAILPAHAPMDGDTIFAAATGTRGRADLTALGHAACQVMARAIARGVFEAAALPFPGAQRAWRDGLSSVHATPRRKSIHNPVPVKPVWPIVSGEQPSPPDHPGWRASHPTVRVLVARVRIASIPAGEKRSPLSTPRAKSITPSTVPNAPACPAAPPKANAFSSCTMPRITLPRHAQCSVAAHSIGLGLNIKPRGGGKSSSSAPVSRSMAMPSSMKLMSEYTGGPARHSLCRMKARSVSASWP
jgi:L-aminopeptidase/D-esterase-like protein